MRQNTVVGNTWRKEAYLIKDWLTSYLLPPSMAIDQVVLWTQQGLVLCWRWGPVCFTNSRLTLEHTTFWGQLVSKPHHCRHTSFHTSGGYLAVGLLVPSIVLSLTFWDADKLFSKWSYCLISHWHFSPFLYQQRLLFDLLHLFYWAWSFDFAF